MYQLEHQIGAATVFGISERLGAYGTLGSRHVNRHEADRIVTQSANKRVANVIKETREDSAKREGEAAASAIDGLSISDIAYYVVATDERFLEALAAISNPARSVEQIQQEIGRINRIKPSKKRAALNRAQEISNNNELLQGQTWPDPLETLAHLQQGGRFSETLALDFGEKHAPACSALNLVDFAMWSLSTDSAVPLSLAKALHRYRSDSPEERRSKLKRFLVRQLSREKRDLLEKITSLAKRRGFTGVWEALALMKREPKSIWASVAKDPSKQGFEEPLQVASTQARTGLITIQLGRKEAKLEQRFGPGGEVAENQGKLPDSCKSTDAVTVAYDRISGRAIAYPQTLKFADEADGGGHQTNQRNDAIQWLTNIREAIIKGAEMPGLSALVSRMLNLPEDLATHEILWVPAVILDGDAFTRDIETIRKNLDPVVREKVFVGDSEDFARYLQQRHLPR